MSATEHDVSYVIEEEKMRNVCRQGMIGAGIGLMVLLLSWAVITFDRTEKTPLPQPKTALELLEEQGKELQAIRIAVEKLAK